MKFSVIMGTYNPNLDWLIRALDSTHIHDAVNFNKPDCKPLFDEVVLVDDGTTNIDLEEETELDCHVTGVGLLPTKFKFIKHKKNKGFYEAKNTAIKAATGDIICTLDDDDYFNAEGVLKLKERIESDYKTGTESDIYHFVLQGFNYDTSLFGKGANPRELPNNNSIPGISWYKKSLWEKLGGFQYPLAEDWDFWLRAYEAGASFSYVDEIVYNVNRRPDSVSAKWTGAIFDKIRHEVRQRNSLEP